jgi:hypothetical protein
MSKEVCTMSPALTLITNEQHSKPPDYKKLYHTASSQLIDIKIQIDKCLLLLEDMYLDQTEPDIKQKHPQ